MRIWLRIGAAFIFVVMMRNFLVGYAFAPSLFSFSCCLIIDLLLGKLAKPRHLEWIALFIGVFAMLPLIGHILEYGPTPNAPALVVTPSVVLFTALLSQGPATWAVVLLQMVLLGWVGWDKERSLLQARLLGNLLLDFLIVAVAVRGIFGLRRRFAATLRQQESDLLEVGRRQRRLSGMLFHDTRNYLQALTLQAECADDPEMRDHARSLSHRIARLVRLSKQFLMDKSADAPLELTSVDLNDVVESLVEAYGPRMESKGLRLTADVSEASRVMADRDLLVESVMGNLLSNAIKFSPSGGAIELRAKSEGSFVCIHLRDEGPGVPPEVVDLLGQEGPVPSHVGTAGEEGQGYGLQLVREHTAKMGGRLALEARAPRGTDAAIWLAAA
jgi:signal transduction histidine kinase